MQTTLLVLIFIVFVAALVSAATSKVKDLDTFRAEATDQFAVWLVGDSASQFGLKPRSCEIVKRSETFGNDRYPHEADPAPPSNTETGAMRCYI